MNKKLLIKVAEYESDSKKSIKSEYVDAGAINISDKGVFLFLDPAVSLSGCLLKQNLFLEKKGEPIISSVIVTVVDESDLNYDEH